MFEFLTEQEPAHANLKLHCRYGPLRLALQCDSEETYATIDEAGVRLSESRPSGGVGFTMAAVAWAELRHNQTYRILDDKGHFWLNHELAAHSPVRPVSAGIPTSKRSYDLASAAAARRSFLLVRP